jgi:hypothetical protein
MLNRSDGSGFDLGDSGSYPYPEDRRDRGDAQLRSRRARGVKPIRLHEDYIPVPDDETIMATATTIAGSDDPDDGPTEVPMGQPRNEGTEPPRKLPRLRLVFNNHRTEVNGFNLFREYIRRPTKIRRPEANLTSIVDLESQSSNLNPELVSSESSNSSFPPTAPSSAELDSARRLRAALGPFPNFSTFLYTREFIYNDSGNTTNEFSDRLIKHVITHPDYIKEDMSNFRLGYMKQKISEWEPSPFREHEGWRRSNVEIEVPLGKSRLIQARSAKFSVPDVQHRSIVEQVERVVAADENVESFLVDPFEEFHRDPATNQTERVITEPLSADCARQQFQEVHRKKIDGCTLARVVIWLQFWSDATRLAQFGFHKLWPIYMTLANQLFWQRANSNMNSWHDIAHIPEVRLERF